MSLAFGSNLHAAEPVTCDLLIVGGNEAGVAAAVQAARLGVPHVVLVNDIEWLGGQFSAEGVGCLDEWTLYRGKRVNFPRSGLFLELVREIRKRNAIKYGIPNPGNAWCGTDTIEPAAAAKIFADLIAQYEKPRDDKTGRITYLHSWEPVSVRTEKNAVRAVEFVAPDDPKKTLVVTARLTIDCSDLGDVIRLSGARYSAGPDLKKRFGEPGAPEGPLADDRNEMNPLSWCVVLREAGKDSTIAKPDGYNPRSFTALDSTPPFVEWDGVDGVYSKAGWSVYTHRRLVDRRHNKFAEGTEATFLNWPVQDYPLYAFPKAVADALEATEAGASKKNIVDMTTAQRRIVYADAKQHALGMLYHLQTKVHDRVGNFPESFRYMRLTDEFGTPDRLPPKPYIREGLRLEALYMLRETDIRAADRNPKWAKSMVPDGVFGFQFNIDFHPTRRKFLDGGNTGPWQFVHTANRNWHTDTDRGMVPLRSLVPVELDGLLGSSKNIGVTSLVSAAVRVHGQMVLCGQAAGTVAAVCLKEARQPREIARDWKSVRDVQRLLVQPSGGAPGVLLWPYHDLSPDDQHFEAVNHLAVRGIWPGDADSLDFRAHDPVSKSELSAILARVSELVIVPVGKPERPLAGTGTANWKDLSDGLSSLRLKPPPGLTKDGTQPLLRYELARILWATVRELPERLPDLKNFLTPGNDADGDGLTDLEDPLPLTMVRIEPSKFSESKKDGDGFLVHDVTSPYQAAATQIRVLLPDKLDPAKRYQVVYVLPVEAGIESRFGDGLKEVKKLDLHNTLGVVFVAPTFAHLPWYADHPTKPNLRQETYLLKVVLPFVEKTYPVKAQAESRLLLGFSKSGWGAFSLLLRNPDVFGRAAAWDAPLMLEKPGKYGSSDIFGNDDNFTGYHVSKLLTDNAARLQTQKRLILLGYGNFRAETSAAHELMEKLKIAHEYRDGPNRKHDWHSGWVKESVELLLQPALKK